MKHLDLFSGIGGFALATEAVWPDAEHVFVEIDPFCQQVLKKNFPNSTVYADIKTFKTDNIGRIDLLTGGFPCQPFSQAGKRRAQDDDRFLWPEMLRIIHEAKPTWIIGENVAGIINLALEQVCADLEAEGYEVQPIIVPACAVNAPHRRDRVWIVAHAKDRGSISEMGLERKQDEEATKHCDGGFDATDPTSCGHRGESSEERGAEKRKLESIESEGCEVRGEGEGCDCVVADTSCERRQQKSRGSLGNESSDEGWTEEDNHQSSGEDQIFDPTDWERNWVEVATELCGVDDGLPLELDGLKLTKAKHRTERLKALGNAIVPQVAIEIMKAIHKFQP